MPLSIHTTFCDLSSALKLMESLAPSRPPVPILEAVLVTADPGGVRLESYDFETHVTVNLPCDRITGEGQLLVSLGRLASYIKTLQAGSTRAKAACLPIVLHERSGKAVITADGYTYTLALKDLDDYPERPAYEPTSFASVSRDALLAAVDRVAVCAGADQTLPMLTGIKFTQVDGGLELAATDRFRLGIDFVPVLERASTEKFDALVDAKRLVKILKNLPSGVVQLSTCKTGKGETWNYLRLCAHNVVVSTVMLETEFVKYRSLLPSEHKADVTVGRGDLDTALKRVGAAVDRGHHAIFDFADSTVTVQAGGDEEGAVTSRPLPIEQRGEDLGRIAFNPGYIGAALKTFDADAIDVRLVAAGRPILIAEPGRLDDERAYRTLVMPARLPG